MTRKMHLLATAAALSLLSGLAQAEVTVLGWPGGPEEAALRAVTKEDVRAILRQLSLSVSYLLTREEGTADV